MSSENEPNWVDKWTLCTSIITCAVLAATLVGVIKYACEAHRQNVLLRESIGQQIQGVHEQVLGNRPVIMANGAFAYTIGKDKRLTPTPQNVLPEGVQIRLLNFGRSVAVDAFDHGHLMIVNQGEPPPIDPECDESQRPKKESDRTALAPFPYGEWFRQWTILQGEDIEDVNSGKELYAVGCVYYGDLTKHIYYSDICLTWARNRGNNPFQACQDPKRNYVQ